MSTPLADKPLKIKEHLKAYEMFRQSLTRLTSQDNLQTFFQTLLLEMTVNTHANNSAVFIYHQAQHHLQMIATVHQGTVRDIQHDPVFSVWREPVPADITPIWRRLCEQRQTLCIDHDNPPPEHWPFGRDWHSEQGHKTILVMPMLLGDDVLGFLGLCFTSRLTPSPAQQAECETFALQAAIAYKFKALADEARLAAIAKEQENAANERARRLSETFAALRRTSAILAHDFDLKIFLEHVLLEINAQFQADAAILSLYDETKMQFTALAHVEDGKLKMKESFSCTLSSAEIFLQALIATHGCIREFDVESEAHLLLSCSLQYHRQRQHARIFALPLMLGEQVKGYIGVALRTRETIVLHQQELLLALAHQASMAIQLTRLADSTQNNAVLAERNRMAREIHDTLAQGFAAILVNLKNLRKALPALPGAVTTVLETVQQLAEDNLIEARQSVRALRPRALRQGSLLDGLRHLLDSLGRATEVMIDLNEDEAIPAIPEESEDELLRIAQEALQNALRHGQATHVSITLRAAEHQGLHLSISDDGCGFDQNATPFGYGLIGISERAARIGAALTIISEPGFGTQIIVAWQPALPGNPR
ncbi:MAG: histidine kinase [Methylovulum sp.]|nr:histidine kinase [Methylovulum sp.]